LFIYRMFIKLKNRFKYLLALVFAITLSSAVASNLSTSMLPFYSGAERSLKINYLHDIDLTQIISGTMECTIERSYALNSLLDNSTFRPYSAGKDLNRGSLEIGGFVYALTNIAKKCRIYLVQVDSAVSKYEIIDTVSTNDSNGYYLFADLLPGNYLLKAIPDSSSILFGKFFPTYFGDVLYWNNSPLIQLTASGYSYDIHMVESSTVIGNGMVSGTIVKNKKSAKDIQVMLLSHDNIPIAYIFSGQDGQFSFDQIPFGTYKIFVELLGEATHPGIIILDATHTQVRNLFIELVSQIGLFEINKDKLIVLGSVFPNPCTDKAKISINVPDVAIIKIELFDEHGREVKTDYKKLNKNDEVAEVDMGFLKKGVYFMRMNVNNEQIAVYKVFKN
jgi:hypothetical protein